MFGSATFDPETRTAKTELSGDMQALYDRLYGRADESAAESAAMGTGEEAAGRYGDIRRSLSQESQYASNLRDANRLRAQGRDVTSGGHNQAATNSMFQRRAENEAVAGDWDRAQAYKGLLRDREMADLTQTMKIGALPQDYLSSGQGIGSGMSSASQYGAGLMSDAAIASLGAKSNMYSGVATALQNVDWNGDKNKQFPTEKPAWW